MLPWKLRKCQIFKVSACELQPFSCHNLANDIYSETAKTVFSHLKRRFHRYSRRGILNSLSWGIDVWRKKVTSGHRTRTFRSLFLRWPKPFYMRVGYVFESRFSAGKIKPISMIFGILNKEWWNLVENVIYFLVAVEKFEISTYV